MREMFLEKGFDDFLAKPIDVSKLDDILDRWIAREKREERREKREEKKNIEEKKLVLLVDNNVSNLKLGMSALEEKFDVVTAPSIEKMLKLLEKNNPALILMNADMRDSAPAGLSIIFIDEPFEPSGLVACVENNIMEGNHGTKS